MRRLITFAFCIIAFTTGVGSFRSEAQVSDAGLWTNITLEKKITKNLDAVFTQEFRLNENITELGTFLSELGADYKIWKGLKAGLYYRYGFKQRLDGSYSQAHRVFLNLSYKQKIKRFEASYRVRLQMQYRDVNRSETGKIPDWYLRQKLHLGYNTKSRFDPYLDGEIWYSLEPGRSCFDNLRLSAGVVTRLSKKHTVDVGYLFQKELNTPDPLTDHILFVGYTIAF